MMKDGDVKGGAVRVEVPTRCSAGAYSLEPKLGSAEGLSMLQQGQSRSALDQIACFFRHFHIIPRFSKTDEMETLRRCALLLHCAAVRHKVLASECTPASAATPTRFSLACRTEQPYPRSMLLRSPD